MQPLSLDHEFDAIECRIRTLTTLLQNMQPRSPSDESDRSTAGLWDHLLDLFQCDDEKGGHFTNRFAMTGVETSDGLRILAVTENMNTESNNVKVTGIMKSDRSFDDLVNRQISSSVQDHISDVWTALALFDEGSNDPQQRFRALTLFIVARKFRRISSLLRDISLPSRLELPKILLDWEPQPYDLQESRWIRVPSWLISIHQHKWHNWDVMKHRIVATPAGDEVHWELSSVTAKSWTGLLASILEELVSAIQKHKRIVESKSGDTSTLENIVTWTSLLSSFFHWEEGVLHTLLGETSFSFKLSTHPFNQSDSERNKSTLTSGTHILRHLKRIVAWHDALQNLCFNEEYSSIRKLPQTHATCLVQIPVESDSEKNGTCSTHEDLPAQFIKQCTPSDETLGLFREVLNESYKSQLFASIHTEAVLMGLIAHFSPTSAFNFTAYGVEFKQETRVLLEEFIRPLGTEKIIVLSDNSASCSCCRWLGTQLNNGFHMPSTKGGEFAQTSAWTPPVGVDILLLEELEANLLDELDFRLRIIKLCTSHADHPDAFSDDGYAATISDYSSPEEADFDVSD